ncbi:MAG: TIGR01459 family HAD-type hydrolase [Allosphingosinicella sp.]
MMPGLADAYGGTLLGLSEVAERYDCVLLDVWGVLIDGARTFPAATSCLARLADNRVPTILVSNTSRRGSDLQQMLAGIGLEPDSYTAAITAGDAAFEIVAERHPVLSGARRCVVVGEQPGGHWAEEAGAVVTDDPMQADFVLALGILPCGWHNDRTGVMVERALQQGLPFLVSNPDRRVMVDGVLHDCVGLLTDLLRPLGGRVIETGKPHSPIFKQALATAARLGPAAQRPLMIGDSLETDIRGATQIGIDSLLIRAGGSGCMREFMYLPTWTMGALKW